MKHFLRACVFGIGLATLLPGPADAHRMWMLPSATVLSGEDAWVTVDAAISNDLFYFNYHPLRPEGLTVSGPDGMQIEVRNVSVGKYRSSFDVQLAQAGTYKLSIENDSLMARYKENGEEKRWRGSAVAFAAEVPAGAEDLRVRHTQRRVETFATVGAPTDAVLVAQGNGLEMLPLTHPNDLFVGETGRFRLMLDGKPVPGVEVEIVRGGTRYRDRLETIHAKTDDEGVLQVTWPEAGYYLMEASVQDDLSIVQDAEGRTASYTATLEVLPQ